MYLKKRNPLLTIAKLLAQHERYIERGREFYSKAGQKLNKALELQAPLGEPIPMPDGRRVIIRDQFADSNVAFATSSAHRYKIEPFRPGKVALPTRPLPEKKAAAAPKSDRFVDLTVDFPADDVPVRVKTRNGITGMAAYCTEAGQWYVVRKGHPSHRLLWIDAFGPKSEIVSWAPASNS